MKIDKAAIAGTLESSDCMVTVEPGNGSVELELESVVMNQFGEQIQKVVRGDVGAPGCRKMYLSVLWTKGALDCTVKARVECAVYRSAGQKTDVPWGGCGFDNESK